MARKLDKEVLAGFIEEAQSYVSTILKRLEEFRAEPSRPETMEEAHRYSHTIKGAASMIGLAGLSHIAHYVEESIEDLAAGKLAMSDETAAQMHQMILLIQGCLDGLKCGTFDEQPWLDAATRIHARMHGLPEQEDDAALPEARVEAETLPGSGSGGDVQPDAGSEIKTPQPEELSHELLETFSLEADDHLRNISALLRTLDKDPGDREALQDVRRSVHTLKGAAGAVGLSAIAQLSHRMEDLLDRLFDGSMVVDAKVLELLFRSSDVLEDMVGGQVEEKQDRRTLQQDLYSRYSALLGETTSAERLTPELESRREEGIIDLPELAPPQGIGRHEVPDHRAATVPRKPGPVVRVPLARLDELVRLVSELVISRSVFEQRMADFVREVEELRLSSERLRRVSSTMETGYEVSALGGRQALHGGAAVRNPRVNPATSGAEGFDDLQFDRYTEFHLLSRELAETTNDIRTLGNELNNLIGDFDSILNRQGRLSTEIQDELMRTRMIPLATLTTRLHRTVRVLAREQGKLANLVVEGEGIELDTTVLNAIADPLLHLLRNAVDHGIEPPELRKMMHKPERGLISLRAYHEGNQMVLQVGDDGAGLKPNLLRSAAVRRGYVSEVDAAQLGDEELYELAFLPGLTTVGEVSEVSGRGVGLDIVRTNVEKLKGTVAVESSPGQGTTYTIRLPMTLAVTRALLIKARKETFAIPLDAVTQILRLERDDIEHLGQEPVVRVGDQIYPLLGLDEVLRLRQPADETVKRMPVLIIKAGAAKVGLAVDQLVAGREIVIKTLGNHLRRVHGITGATIMGDGSVVLIVNPNDLLTGSRQPDDRARRPARRAPAVGDELLAVMIVDDSLSVRQVVSNLIRSAGWHPIAARDGIEALEILQRSAQQPDLILVDIEMPRMDGYELMSTLKAHDAYGSIPLVVLTSRAGEKHRVKAFEVGAADYVVKPYQDEVMLNIIRRLVTSSRRVASV